MLRCCVLCSNRRQKADAQTLWKGRRELSPFLLSLSLPALLPPCASRELSTLLLSTARVSSGGCNCSLYSFGRCAPARYPKTQTSSIPQWTRNRGLRVRRTTKAVPDHGSRFLVSAPVVLWSRFLFLCVLKKKKNYTCCMYLQHFTDERSDRGTALDKKSQ